MRKMCVRVLCSPGRLISTITASHCISVLLKQWILILSIEQTKAQKGRVMGTLSQYEVWGLGSQRSTVLYPNYVPGTAGDRM